MRRSDFIIKQQFLTEELDATLEGLLHTCDQRLYAAKSQGRYQVVSNG